MITSKEAQTLPLDQLERRIKMEEEALDMIKEIYRMRCEWITLDKAAEMTGERKNYAERR